MIPTQYKFLRLKSRQWLHDRHLLVRDTVVEPSLPAEVGWDRSPRGGTAEVGDEV